jgi:hypothetical protein
METMSDAAEKSRLAEITFDKHLRFRLDEAIQELRVRPGSAERTLAFRALQTARHWLGEDLAILGAQHPYPNGNNPANTIVDPPADVASRLEAAGHFVGEKPDPCPEQVRRSLAGESGRC